jgi:hypothetical protein
MADDVPAAVPQAVPRTSYELLDEADRRQRIRQSSVALGRQTRVLRRLGAM